MAKSGSICDIWLLELVLYTVKLVPMLNKLRIRAQACFDAKLHVHNKIIYPLLQAREKMLGEE
jgi:hypothetical protein